MEVTYDAAVAYWCGRRKYNKKIGGNPDVVIVFTGTVAHKMVNVAAEQAQKTGAVIKHCHSSSICALNDALCEYFSKA